MSDCSRNDENPYLSPTAETYPTAGDKIVVLPRIAPRDAVDILLGICVTAYIATPTVGVPLATAYYYYGPSLLPMAGALCVGLLFLLPYALVSVWRLSIGPSGIEFKRMAGEPRSLTWEEIGAIRAASRREVFLRGWINPKFPPREPSNTMTARGHYRIEWTGGYCYFPPNNAEQFAQER